jgi:hypothetical protein
MSTTENPLSAGVNEVSRDPLHGTRYGLEKDQVVKELILRNCAELSIRIDQLERAYRLSKKIFSAIEPYSEAGSNDTTTDEFRELYRTLVRLTKGEDYIWVDEEIRFHVEGLIELFADYIPDLAEEAAAPVATVASKEVQP